MTTTEWVERYNRAFEEADRVQTLDWAMDMFAKQVDRSAKEGFDRLMETERVNWTLPKNAHEALFPSNPSPSDPKEVVDDTPSQQNPLNQKEKPNKVMKSFWSISRHEIIGRGTVFQVRIEHDEDLPYKKELVLIDGEFYRVRSVEMAHGLNRKPEVGLVVTKVEVKPAC